MKIEQWAAPLAIWCVLLGVYLVLTGETSADEVVAGALASAAATLLAILMHRIAARHFKFRQVRWKHLVVSTANSLITDTARVAVSLLRPSPPSGGFVRRTMASHGRDAEQAACRAVLVLAGSMTPNAYVIWELDSKGEWLLHRLRDTQE